MEFQRGLVVRSLSGHDKGGYFVILEHDSRFAVICDGRRRKLEKPKKKNLIHLAATNTIAEEGSIMTDRGIRKLLSPFNGGTENTMLSD